MENLVNFDGFHSFALHCKHVRNRSLVGAIGPTLRVGTRIVSRHPWGEPARQLNARQALPKDGGQGIPIVYCEKIRVFKAGLCR